MITQPSNRLFFIIVAVLVMVVSVFQHPYLKPKFNSDYRIGLFEKLKRDLLANEFDPEKYWEFRERFSPGTFLRDEEFTGFYGTFRIISVADAVTPLFYYDSTYLRSLDAVVSSTADEALKKITNEFPGEIVSKGNDFVLIKATDTEYVFAFVESIEEMQKVVGMFDYIPKEKELLKDKLWYNATYLKVN